MYSISKSGKVTIIEELISKEKEDDDENYTGYVGKYADVDGDGTVDGIIYADLANESITDKNWGSNSYGTYSITQVVTANLGEYYISQENYEDKFGTEAVVSLACGGTTERFYVMALTNFTADSKGTFDWYKAAYGKMSDYRSTTSTAFGTGKQNTATMISKWNSKAYGDQDVCAAHKDMWGQIQAQVNKGWYVPSRGEWAAFADAFKISKESTDENYYVYLGLSTYYWSSSQEDSSYAWITVFNHGGLGTNTVNNGNCVRLATTF